MKKIYFLLGSVLLSLSSGFAQENHLRNSKWFSYGTQLQFQPYSTPQATANPFSGFVTASVCDQNGDSLIVVNSYNGTVWAKGQNIGTISSAMNINNTIIVPKPKHSDRYYIITSSENMGLNYTEVNLATLTLINNETPLEDLNGNPILLSPGGSGVASTVHANGIDYWITAFANDTLMSYLVTENGIDTTLSSFSSLPLSEAYASLKIKISPKSSYDNKKHIAIVNFYNGTSLKDFNDETGEIVDSYSNMNYSLEQRNFNNLNNLIHSVDAEFSADGNILYCVDDINNYGSVYAIQESGNIIPTGEYGGFITSQRGSDDSVYFLDGYGYLSQEQPNSTNYPSNTGISLFYYGSFYQWGYLPQLVSFNDCLASPAMIPTFSPTYICKGTTSYSLPTTSNNGITGSWSSVFDNTATKTYTFTPDQGQCAAETTNLTVVVNDQNTIPTFNSYPDYVYLPTSVCVGSSYTFPTTSSNGIIGTWSPDFNNLAETTYTFTPNAGQCGTITTHTITINQKVTPTFNSIAPICAGDTLSPLPTTSINGYIGHWSPAVNNTETKIYTFTPISAYCATATSMTVTVNPIATPTFDSIAPICAGSSLILPTTSLNGYTGTWSPAVNNTATTTYTFTPNAGQCSTIQSQTVTVKTAPVFDEIGMINNGTIKYTLPIISTNGIVGTWSPTTVSEGERVHTYTPNTGECPITKSFLLMKQTTIDAVDDDFSYSPIEEGDFNQDGDYYTSSVFDNDSIIFENIVSDYNASVSILSVTPPNYGDPFVMMPNGTIKIHRGTPYGTYSVVYKITQNNCSEKYDTATATVYIPDPNANSRMAAKTQQLSENISVYPNPSKDIFNFDLTNIKGDYDTVTVYNMLGAKIYENSLRGNSFNLIDLSDLATGFYIAKVSGKSGIASFQLIKQ